MENQFTDYSAMRGLWQEGPGCAVGQKLSGVRLPGGLQLRSTGSKVGLGEAQDPKVCLISFECHRNEIVRQHKG